jgi:hypothetical protein
MLYMIWIVKVISVSPGLMGVVTEGATFPLVSKEIV